MKVILGMKLHQQGGGTQTLENMTVLPNYNKYGELFINKHTGLSMQTGLPEQPNPLSVKPLLKALKYPGITISDAPQRKSQDTSLKT